MTQGHARGGEGGLVALTCSHCTAPLTDEESSPGVLTCAYCGHAHRFATPPPPPTVHRHPVGSLVVVEWSGRWWDARVLAIPSPDQWTVHYDGWSERWVETVGPHRIRARLGAAHLPRPAKPRSVLVAVALLVIVLAGCMAFALVGGRAARPTTDEQAIAARPDVAFDGLFLGQYVEVEWQGGWYRAQIIALHPNGRVRVHYVGYAASYDEEVGRRRVRLPS